MNTTQPIAPLPQHLIQHRLAEQQITQAQFATPQDLVAWMGAMQGQDYAGAKWSIGLRVPGSTNASIEQALDHKAIVRTWAMRGTLHIVAATDLRWLLKLLGARVLASTAGRYRQLALDAKTFVRSDTAIAKALQDGQPLSRTALVAILNRNGISTTGQRAVHLLQHAALQGLVCQTTAPRNTPTYVAIDETIPHGNPFTYEEAVAELVRRYFSSHGPATLHDFVWWSGLKVSDARAGLAANAEHLVEDTVGERTLWRSKASLSPKPAPSVHLLPGFDEYLLGYGKRDAIIAPEHLRWWTGGNGMFTPLLVINGRLAGNWKRTLARDRVKMQVRCVRPLSPREEEAVHAAAAQFGAFLQLPVTTSIQITTDPEMP